jgi:ASC-1-like (ASCH) protein
MKYDFWVQEPYKSFLLNWQKTVEWRLNKWKFAKIVQWDILFFDSWEEFQILEKNIYKSFYEMMEKEGLENVLPDKEDIQNWVETVYYKFYSKELETKFWVSAIKAKRIK